MRRHLSHWACRWEAHTKIGETPGVGSKMLLPWPTSLPMPEQYPGILLFLESQGEI